MSANPLHPQELPPYQLPVSDSAFISAPYPWLAARREAGPAFYDLAQNEIFFTRHAEVSSLLRDRRLGRALPGAAPPPPGGAAWETIRRFEDNHFFDKEPPDHTRLRGIVSKAFTPARVQALRGRIEALAGELAAGAYARGRMEFVSEFAEPLPVAVICELLGVPHSERSLLRPWSAEIVKMYEMEHASDQAQRSARAIQEFSDYLRGLFNARRQDPQDDLLTALVFAQEGKQRLSMDELISTTILLLNAGHEATVNAAALGLAALLEHDGLPQGAAAPLRWDLMVEELLRYDSPLPLFHRWVYVDGEYGGVILQAGARVGLLLASANRDSRQFTDPNRLDLSRQDNPHLTFGGGLHYCLGAPLARLELQASFQALCRLPAAMKLCAAPIYKPGFVIRGLESLEVGW